MKALPLIAALVLTAAVWAQTDGQVYAPDNVVLTLWDAGFPVTAEEGPYRRVTAIADGGFARLPTSTVLMDTATPFGCACAVNALCTVPVLNILTLVLVRLPAPQGQTLPPGWSGTSCVRKPCVELSGRESSWPSACPCPTALPDGGGRRC